MTRISQMTLSVRTKLAQAREAELRGQFIARCRRFGIPVPETEFQFAAPDRQFRFDFAWPQHRIALESDGGVWTQGAHTRGGGYVKDMEKLNDAALRGWRVFRTVPGQLTELVTLRMIGKALGVQLGEIGTL